MIAALLAVMLLVGGGTSFAAEGAVPGDVLYPVKVDVNEQVRSALMLTDSAEANLQVRLAEERLEEAETLAARGQLTAEVASDIDIRLKAHYEKAETLSSNVEAKGDYTTSATVRASLEGTLRAHAAILSDLNTRIAGNSGVELITNIGLYAGMAADAQTIATATVKTSVDAKVTAETTLDATGALLRKTETALTQAESKLSAGLAAEAKVKLTNAVALEAEAKTSFEAGAYGDAYAASQRAFRLATEVNSITKSALRLPATTNIKVGGSDDTILNIHNGTTSDKTDTETSTGSDTGTGSSTTTPETSKSGSSSTVDSKIDVHTDGTVKTGIIDTTVKTDAVIKTGLGI